MDGGQADGHRLFVVPTFAVGRSPLRIDIYLSDQDNDDLPPQLRETLRFDQAMMVRKSAA
jgi:hypothetical protein